MLSATSVPEVLSGLGAVFTHVEAGEKRCSASRGADDLFDAEALDTLVASLGCAVNGVRSDASSRHLEPV